ncbi:MAG: hypothetical protein DRN26_00255 [Thermoplasmata archaeon]|nr:MAG: hypothetical protein DRN26_00255 [Thermoplasmata archaeon]
MRYGAVKALLSLLFVLPLEAKARCIVHDVQQGETWRGISIQYYKSPYRVKDLLVQNNFPRKLLAGSRVYIYIPTEDDWQAACENAISWRLSMRRRYDRIPTFIQAIPQAIQQVFPSISPERKLDLCISALVTAEQETMYEFMIGSAGEVGIYQFKLDTVRLTGRQTKVLSIASENDEYLVRLLLDPLEATKVFLLHYMYLLQRYEYSHRLAWRRYNNGSMAEAYAERAMDKYTTITRQKLFNCQKFLNGELP